MHLKGQERHTLTSHASEYEILAAVPLGFRLLLMYSLCFFEYSGSGNRCIINFGDTRKHLNGLNYIT